MKEPAGLFITHNYTPKIDNPNPLTVHESDEFLRLFAYARDLNQRLFAGEQQLTKKNKTFYHFEKSANPLDRKIVKSIKKYVKPEQAPTCKITKEELRPLTQHLLETINKIVKFLKIRRKENVDWECNLSSTITLIEKNIKLTESGNDPYLPPNIIADMKKELEAHQDQSSELFLRAAFRTSKLSTDVEDNPVVNCAVKCVKTYNALRKVLETVSTPIDNYEQIVLCIKKFGRAFKHHKIAASSVTNAHLRAHLPEEPNDSETNPAIWNSINSSCTIS